VRIPQQNRMASLLRISLGIKNSKLPVWGQGCQVIFFMQSCRNAAKDHCSKTICQSYLLVWVVQYLLGMYKALGLIPSTEKKGCIANLFLKKESEAGV
jgi:hypothetical protein